MVDLFDGETVILSNPVKSITMLQYRGPSDNTDGGYVEVKLNVGSIVLTNFRVILLTPGGEGVTERFRSGTFKFVKGPSKFQYIFYNTPAFFDIAKKLAAKNKELWKQNLANTKIKYSTITKVAFQMMGNSSGYNPYITLLNGIGYEKSKRNRFVFRSITKETASQYEYKDWDKYYFQLHVVDLVGAEKSVYLKDSNHKVISFISKGISSKKYRVIITPSKKEQANWGDFMNIILDYIDRTNATFPKPKDMRDAYLDIFNSIA